MCVRFVCLCACMCVRARMCVSLCVCDIYTVHVRGKLTPTEHLWENHNSYNYKMAAVQ